MTLTPGFVGATTSGATPVTVVAAPGLRTFRMIKNLTVVNLDTANITVTVKHVTNGGSSFAILKEEVAPGDVAHAHDIILSKTTHSITVVLDGAVAATEADCGANFVDLAP